MTESTAQTLIAAGLSLGGMIINAWVAVVTIRSAHLVKKENDRACGNTKSPLGNSSTTEK